MVNNVSILCIFSPVLVKFVAKNIALPHWICYNPYDCEDFAIFSSTVLIIAVSRRLVSRQKIYASVHYPRTMGKRRTSMEALRILNLVVAIIFAICYAYQTAYVIVPFIVKPKPHKKTSPHSYAILICARNEESVIANLVESLLEQDYPKELIKVFVCADNCTDNTAQVARDAGANVYVRYNKEKVGKGYALNHLLKCINADYDRETFDAYIVFDADNLVDKLFVKEMNKILCDGYNVATSYRNSKNFGDNWISAGYGLWFMRDSQYLNGARMPIDVGCSVAGTGFMFTRSLIEKYGGWNYFLLSEDTEFTVANALAGEKIGYSAASMLYDEQPTTFKKSWKQRLRWARGYMQVFAKYGSKLIKGVFSGSFTCFDICMTILPSFVLSVFCQFANVVGLICGLITGGDITIALLSIWQMLAGCYLMMFLVGAVTTITEWNKIHASTFKKILYTFTFPIFMLTYLPISVAALFGKVTWTPIEHTCSHKLTDVVKTK